MPDYRRLYIPGGTFFFTLVTYQRRKLFTSPQAFELLDLAISKVKTYHPFTIDAFCILPDHVHFLWTMNENDSDYSLRIGQLKRYFTRMYLDNFELNSNINDSRKKRCETAIWQRRFWEHTIRDNDDLSRHIEYIHFNPVKHGLVYAPRDWQNSSFLEYVKNGFYDADWADSTNMKFDGVSFGE